MEGKSLKEYWKDQAISVAGKKGWLTIGQLAQLLEIAETSISEALSDGRIPNYTKLGPEKSKFPIRIPIWAVLFYIDSFYESKPQTQLTLFNPEQP